MAFLRTRETDKGIVVLSSDMSDPAHPVLCEAPADDTETIATKIDRLKRCFEIYRSFPLRVRGRFLLAARRLLYDRRQGLIELLAREVAKPVTEGRIEIYTSLSILDAYGGPLLSKYDRPDPFFDPVQRFVKASRVVMRPTGIVLVIGPYNNPFMTPLAGIVPALAAGAPVLFKPSEHCTAISLVIEEILHDAADETLPVPLRPFELVLGDRTVGDAVMAAFESEPAMSSLVFTGSNAVGEALHRRAAASCKTATCEMGGKDPLIVSEDVRSLRLTAKAAAAGALIFNGQTCAAFERIYVPESIHDRLVSELVRVLADYKQGSPLDPGVSLTSYIDERSFQKVQGLIADAVDKGASIVFGQPMDLDDYVTAGYPVRPVVLTGVTHEMAIMHKETFGAVIPVMATRDDQESFVRAKDSPFGLTAAVFARRPKRLQARVEELLDHFGTVYINDFQTSWTDKALAWGGRKRSGLGAFLGGRFDAPPFTLPATLCRDRFPGLTNPYWQKKDGSTLEILDRLTTLRFGRGPGRLLAAAALPPLMIGFWRRLYLD